MKTLCGMSFVILLLCIDLSAQLASCRQTVLVDAINLEGRRVGALTAQDLSPAKNPGLSILSLEKVARKPRVMILWDISGSMNDRAAPIATRFVILDLLKSFPVDVPIALMVFSQEPRLLTNFSLDRSAAAAAVEKVYEEKMHGRTAIFLALDKAIETFGDSSPGDAIILISDGGNDSGPDLREKLFRKLNLTGIRIFGDLWTTDEPHATVEQVNGARDTSDLIRRTGGSALWSDAEILKSLVKHPDKLKTELEKIALDDREIVGRVLFPYQLTLERTSASDWIRLKLKIAPKRSFDRHKITLTYQDQLPPCSIPESAPQH